MGDREFVDFATVRDLLEAANERRGELFIPPVDEYWSNISIYSESQCVHCYHYIGILLSLIHI